MRTAASRTRPSWRTEKGYAAQLEAFIEGIREGKQPEVTVRDGARATVGCLRMMESARTLNPSVIDLSAVLP